MAAEIIAGGKVRGFFHFEEEKLLSYEVAAEVP